MPGADSPIAMVGNVEKGYLTLALSVDCPPGHSAAPPRQTSIGILAAAVARLEKNQMPADLSRILPMFEASSALLPFSVRLVFANLWLFGAAARRTLEANPQTNASIRTTTAVTMIQGGIKDNILPRRAEVKINFRLLPGDSIQQVIEHVRAAVADERVKVEIFGKEGWEASVISATDSSVFQALKTTIGQVFGPVPVAPYLVTGATDARYFSRICPNVYRFSPLILKSSDLGMMHGIGERISVENLGSMVRFLAQLVKAWDRCP
jgi:carboxypeptidase PM20D1